MRLHFTIKHFAQYFGLYGLVGISLLTLMLLCPVQLNSASAETPDTSTIESSLATKTTVRAYSTVSMALEPNVQVDLVPKSVGAFNASSAKLKVATNNTSGYSLYLQTIDGTTDLHAADSKNSAKISAIQGSMNASNFQNNLNTWGYSLTTSPATEATDYVAVPASSDQAIEQTKGTSTDDSYYLNFASAIDTNLPAGDYQNSVLVSVVANPVVVSGFSKIYYMQEMSASVCESAEMEETGQLVDIRDNKIYWVAKLKDGKCWMTQNLDLDLDSSVALTPDTTNITEPWTPPVSTTKGDVYQVEDPTNHAQTPLNSYDPGMFVVNNPENITKNCGRVEHASECGGLTDVSGEWAPIFVATESSAISNSTQQYDAHYLIGNYYQFNAAVAAHGGTDIGTGNIDVDICPSGWKLPGGDYSKENMNTTYTTTDYYKLFAAYGWDSGYHENENWSYFVATRLDASKQKIYAQPLYLAIFGRIAPISYSEKSPTKLIYTDIMNMWAGGKSNLGAGRTFSTGNAETKFEVGEFSLYPGTAAGFAYVGFPIRCTAK